LQLNYFFEKVHDMADPGNKKKDVVLVVSTHWDREWYEPFQGFRYRLVRLLDDVLDIMEKDSRFSHFQMDGQSIPIEDYLEIRPEKEDLIRKFAGEGRLSIGPWYSMPDEFLVSGESLVRNLQEGIRVASLFGVSSRVGFVCDMFGHNSQLPQILNGFGIKTAFLWRGANEEDHGPVFRWKSPDKSEVIVWRFGPGIGYGEYAFKVRKATEFDVECSLEDLAKSAEEIIEFQSRRCGILPILLFDGVDHLEADPLTGELVEKLKSGKLASSFNIRMGSLDDFSKCLVDNIDKIKNVTEGELRDPCRNSTEDECSVIPGVLSSRIPQKQANARCETLLCLWAEPFSLFAAKSGFNGSESFIQRAWRYILANHAHDSICGCSIDQVHKDMDYRFDQAEIIGEKIKKEALDSITLAVARNFQDKENTPDQIIVLFNPTSGVIDEAVDFTVVLPGDTPVFKEFFGYEDKPGFRINDTDGNEIEYQRISQSSNNPELIIRKYKFPECPQRWNVNVTSNLKIPPYGYRTLLIEKCKSPHRLKAKGLATSSVSAENEFLKIKINSGGLLSILQKKSGRRFDNLLMMENRADIGDGWYRGVAVNDEIHYSGSAMASIACITDGPKKCSFRIETHWPLPEFFDFNNMTRSSTRKTFRVDHIVTLRAGSEYVEVKTIVKNNLLDHRLRVLFPTNVKADYYYADSPFDVIRRNVELHPESHKWSELEIETTPQQSWTSISDEKGGLAIISKGLPESTVRDLEDRPIALTLFRSFRKTVMTKGEPGGQVQGSLEFDYWIYPVDSPVDPVKLGRLGQQLAAGITPVYKSLKKTFDKKTKPVKFKSGLVLPVNHSFLDVKGNVIVSAVKMSAPDSMIVRMFNPSDDITSCMVKVPSGIKKAWLCNLEEKELEEIILREGELHYEVKPRTIVTVKLSLRVK
jgi:glycosyl hydrolase family 38/alpha mannosidase-like protein